jgi:alkylation response protein AidB-like acyl-CoA dehydrogenase
VVDFAFSPEVEAFRREVREFVAREWPEEKRRRASHDTEGAYPEEREFRRKLGERGWLAVSWPEEYGGLGLSALEQYVFYDEMEYFGAPVASTASGIVAPTLMHFGNQEQRDRFLPAIASGDLEFCLGYPEPDAGSDLASLKIRAQEDGDFFVINGIKRWTSSAHRSEYCWLAARTDPDAPKHRGISLFMVDMATPGITVRPIWTMGDYRTNETYWEDVRVPRANLVGELNRGWYYVAAALDFERLMVFPTGGFRAMFDRLVEAVRTAEYDGRRLRDDPLVRQRIGRISVELEATQLLTYRAAAMVASGAIPNYEASMLKMYGTEARQRMSHAATEIFGLYSHLKEGAPGAVLDGEFEREYRVMVMPTFGGGASELQRNIIATRGMGLPRD